ncbi:MAG: hypothetical protein ACWGNV_04580 [Bacteroidales bacterium]
MKKNRMYFPLLLLLFLALAGNYLGCETENWSFEVNCNDCYGYVPDSANLIIYLTINQENPEVPITVYLGPAEEGVVDWRDTTNLSEYYLFAAMDADYTVEATYQSGNKTILTYDGDHMFLYDGKNECGSPCYIVKGGIFDNRLMK